MSDCIETTYPRLYGYGYMFYRGKTVRHHRYAYCQAHGIELEEIEGLVVRHKCDNRACVNPDHLELGTTQDNVDDRMRRGRNTPTAGTINGMAVLTDSQVLEIRERARRELQKDIAKDFGISQSAVSRIVTRKRWTHV